MLADASFVTAVAAHIARISLAIALVIDIVEDHKKSVCIFEGVVGRAEETLESLQRILVVFGLKVQFVVTGHVVPRDADLRDQGVVARKQRQIVVHDVTHGHAKGRIRADEFCDHIVTNVVEFSLGLRLRVCK